MAILFCELGHFKNASGRSRIGRNIPARSDLRRGSIGLCHIGHGRDPVGFADESRVGKNGLPVLVKLVRLYKRDAS
jgi:hypothetical protein